MAASGPEATVSVGPLTAAIETSAASSGRSSRSGKRTDNIDPRCRSCISRPRSATSGSASSSDITPAITAATNSPTLCPIMADGWIPQLIHSLASEYSIAKIAGWANFVFISRLAASGEFTAG